VTRSPTVAIASVIRPPAAAPWNARSTINMVMLCAAPHSARCHEEAGKRDLEQPLAPVAIAELAPERRRRGRDDHIRRDDPGEVGETPEVARDRRQGGINL
jgi:hypothetical protein